MMAGGLVIEGEGVEVVGVGGEADTDDAGMLGGAGDVVDPVEGRCDGLGPGGRRGAVGGVEGVGEEGVLDVGGGELEVLLLMFETEDDAALGFVLGMTTEEAPDGGVDESTTLAEYQPHPAYN